MVGADQIQSLAETLHAEATRTNERRLITLHGNRDACVEGLQAIFNGEAVTRSAATVVSQREDIAIERVAPDRATTLLGTTHETVVLDCHDTCAPNALGQIVGAVDGGGLFILLCPDLDEWPATACEFHDSLAVPPASPDSVTNRYHTRLAEMLRSHRGIAVVDITDGRIESTGCTNPAPRLRTSSPGVPESHTFPVGAYEDCITDDQCEAVHALEDLREPNTAVVMEADRGRGKSSAAGLAAASFVMEGQDVLVTAPERDGTSVLFERAEALLDSFELLATGDSTDGVLTARDGGQLRYAPPKAAVAQASAVDCLIVEEAAGVAVHRLEETLSADRVAYVTTIHGYEGSGRGFAVRFKERLAESSMDVREITLSEPIRYAPADPIEVWAFRTLALNARPPVDQLVSDATEETTTPETPDATTFVSDERRLRQVFGLLVEAHYRTEPGDLVRLLDAPNIDLYTRQYDGYPVSVALVATEGGLDESRRHQMYRGQRVRGNMLPDILTSQLRDKDAAALTGYRILRIATHASVRSRGIGSGVINDIRAEIDDPIDWIGVGFGATPQLIEFWEANGFRIIHLSTTRNDRSGDYSALMFRPTSGAGEELIERHSAWFVDRIPAVLSDACRDMNPDIVRAALRATSATVTPSLSPPEWRVIAGAGYGSGFADMDPRPFRKLAMAHLVDPESGASLNEQEEQLLVLKSLQARSWQTVTERLGYDSQSVCMRAFGAAGAALADRFGDEYLNAERSRLTE